MRFPGNDDSCFTNRSKFIEYLTNLLLMDRVTGNYVILNKYGEKRKYVIILSFVCIYVNIVFINMKQK